MSKIKWLLAATGAALIGLAPVLGVSSSAGADARACRLPTGISL